jgi:photosystem II stability/assembly factor-like uncharacterized protein
MKKLIYTPAIFLFISLLSITSLYSQQYKWHALPNAPSKSARLEDLFFIDAFTGYTTVPSDLAENLYKTTDGGNTWINLSDTALSYPRCMTFINANTGWIGTYLGVWPASYPGVYKTTNGGLNWENQFASFSDTTMGVCGITALDENNIFACGRWYAPAKFYKSTNGGTNWSIKDMSSYATRLIDCYFTSPDSGILVGGIGDTISTGYGVVLFTSDGGDTWVTKYMTQNNKQWGWKINFPSRNTGYISLERFTSGGGASYFLKTTNGGETWEEKMFSNIPLDEEGVGFANNNTGWIGGWFFPTRKTTNGGINWVSDPWGYNVNRFRFINDTLGYAVGRTVYKYERDTSVGISNISSSFPEKYDLSQNYPNPFNPTTTIEFQVVDYEYTKLSVFDILGREIQTLVNERLRPGVYRYKFDAIGIQSGVYFYRIETQRYTETKKMILLK